MNIEKFANFALNNLSIMCYIVDVETYELLYINEPARVTFMPFAKEFTAGQKCYEFLHAKDSVCSICNNSLLQEGKKLYTEIQNEKNGKYYNHIDTLLDFEGQKVKVTYAYDTSAQKEEIESLTRKISVEETLIKCIQTLIDDSDTHKAIIELLSIVCEFYDADRAYLFEVDHKTSTAKNTYEWSISSDLATIDSTPILSLEELKPILDSFEATGEMSIQNIETELDTSSALYKVLRDTDSRSLLLAPIHSNGLITYFIGVDNPKEYTKDSSLLHSVIIFVADEIRKSKAIKQLEHLSYTDILTGLNNRNKYLERLEEINLTKLNSLGYVHVNINALKRMNELYGEAYGDSILKQVSDCLAKHLKTDLFRISGDEFVALCQNITKQKFDDLVSKLREEDKQQTEFSFAVGGVWQDKKIDIRQGLMQAGDIMISEKQNYYKAQVTDKLQSRLNPVEILLNEIRSNMFTIHLQPKVDLLTGKIASAEALVRKFGTDGKMIPPDRFIPIYENESTIRHLDFFVLDEVCALMQGLIKEGRPLPIAVNFSRVTLLSYDIIDEIVKTCRKYQVPHKYIKIELTESMDKMDFDFFHNKVSQLHELGFEVSLDDFGAKHSNLLMLTMAEFSEVKIDKGLIDHITTSAENRTVVRSIIKTIKELGKSSCVAEGIETHEQMELLQEFGCTYGQGYYFYRPMTVADFLKVYVVNNEISTEVKMIGNYVSQSYDVNYDELYSIIEAMPLCMNLWNHKRENIMCNNHAVDLFDLQDKREYQNRFPELSPEIQPDGRYSAEAALQYMNEARNHGYAKFNWMHCKLNGEEIPCEITLVKLDVKSIDGDYLIAGFLRDLRPQLAGTEDVNLADAYFFNEVSDKTLFNIISDISAEFFWAYNNRTKKIQFFGQGIKILGLPTSKLDFPDEIYKRKVVPDGSLKIFGEFVQAMEEGRHLPIDVQFCNPEGIADNFKIDYRIIFDKENKPLFCIGKTFVVEDFLAG